MKMLKITLQGKTYEVGVESMDSPATAGAPVAAAAPAAFTPASAPASASVSAPVSVPTPVAAPAAAVVAPLPGGQSVTSPMPGLVFKVRVTVGQQVAQDEELLVLDAMKMESPVYAPCAGTVASILVKESDAVVEGQVLIQLS